MNDIHQKRAALVADARKILDVADREGRSCTAEEQQKFDAIMADVDALGDEIRQAEAVAERRSKLETLEGELREVRRSPVADRKSADDGEQRAVKPTETAEYRSAMDRYLRFGLNSLKPAELRALQVGTDSEGGYLTFDEFNSIYVATMDELQPWRSICTVVQTDGDHNIPVESSLGTAAWTAEEAADTLADLAYSRVTLGAHKASTIIKVSEELMRDSIFDMSSHLARSFARRIGVLEDAAFAAGNGSGKPTGITSGASAGVTAAGAAAITTDELIDLYHSLKTPYRVRASWVMKDSTAKLIRKLKDSTNQYLWQPGLQAGQPDTLLGRPLYTSDGMPAATTGLVSVVFGDMSYYWIADRGPRTLQRLNELYAANGQVGFRMFQRVDGKLTLSEAVKKLTQA